MLTIIIPTMNEIAHTVIGQTFVRFAELKNTEIIVVDTNSTDGTVELAEKYNFKIIKTDSMCRAQRLNLGIKQAQGEMILLHHPRSIIDLSGFRFLQNNPELTWGAFTHRFDQETLGLKLTSFYSNYIRSMRGIFYLDHCIFVKKSLLEKINFIPKVDIFEDTELSKKLRRITKPVLLDYYSTTSSIRFKKNGFLRQVLLNQVLKLKYYFNINHEVLNKSYEKDLNLNSNYIGDDTTLP
jgi:glycosyltransferase involved in cell wall biosynthesis